MLKTNSSLHSKKFPWWLKRSVAINAETQAIRKLVRDLRINTVCQRARCPNIYDCFSRRKCTFLILGNYCTRDCRFCSIETRRGFLGPPDKEELFNIKEAVKILGIQKAVITSVTRDDLEDGGAGHFAESMDVLRDFDPDLHIEVLVPDFSGKTSSVERVVSANPDVFSHNLETVPRLYRSVRPQAYYQRSLDILKCAKKSNNNLLIKSGLMVGLGETREEVYEVMRDLAGIGCDMITIGQYLKPDPRCLDVREFLDPEEFVKFSGWAEDMGFKKFSCSPFTRSSYLE